MTREDIEALLASEAPQLWKNFQLSANNVVYHAVLETRLFSDASVLGEVRDIGPLSVLNGLSIRPKGSDFVMMPVAILRLRDHRPRGRFRFNLESKFGHYHGGTIYDEAAALIGLILDIRVSSGPVEREFGYDDDPLGRPRAYSSLYEPNYNPGHQPEQMPRLHRSAELEALAKINDLRRLNQHDASALIKAARLYQNATWIANTAPEMAWLLYVAAAETVAVRYDQTRPGHAEDLDQLHPEIFRILDEGGAAHLIPQIARTMRTLSAATSKFVRFILTFAPPPPEVRPDHDNFSFSRQSIKEAMGIIYKHRSAALHGGTAFPLPMCQAPQVFESGGIAEKSGGLAMHTTDTTWAAEDAPMLLGTFSYIVRGALLAWWDNAIATAGCDLSHLIAGPVGKALP